ncbi:MAG: EamA family transporter [Pseudomonadota bacterium]
MSASIIALVLLSAALHPLREFFIKGDQSPEAVTFAVILVFGLLSSIHVLVSGVDPWSAFAVWPMVLVSAFGVAAYYLCVLGTLRTGDLSIYYPITRSSPIFVVVFGYLVLGQTYSAVLLLGIALVIVGAFMLQYRRGASFFAQPLTLTFAILAMCAHGVITLADAKAMEKVEPMAFLFLLYLLLVPLTGAIFICLRPKKVSIYHHLISGWLRTPVRFLFAGTASYVSYYLILTAFQLGANVAAVSAVRQVSIPFSVLLGCLILKEERMTGRLAWSILLALGVVVIMVSD